MMLQANYSLKSIRSIIRLPIIIVNLLFIVIVFSFSLHNSVMNQETILNDLDSMIRSQESLIKSELFFGQNEAISLRLKTIQSQFEKKYPEENFTFVLDDSKSPDTVDCSYYKIFSIADENLSCLKINFTKKNIFLDAVPISAWIALIFSTSIALVIVQLLGQLVDFKIVSPLLEETRRIANMNAISSTTQAFAHDVRKPFSMMIHLLDTLNSNMDEKFKKSILKLGLREIKISLNHVDILIENIMNFNKEEILNLALYDPAFIISEILKECFLFTKKTDIKFGYNLEHSSYALVDLIQFKRVFVNIINNALEAMNRSGSIYFSTKNIIDYGQGFIEFKITNTGSFISENNIDHIFDLFYTKGKKNGNGIGLATSKKIIELHGGTIRCISDNHLGTTFVFTVKAKKDKKSKLKFQLSELPNTSMDCNANQICESKKNENKIND